MSYRDIYDKIAAQPHDYVLAGYHHIRRFELALGFLRNILKETTNTRIHYLIDIGGGDGFLDELINRHFEGFIEIVGIDISRTRVKRAQGRVPSGSYILADIYHMPFQSAFNISIVSEIVEHLRQPQAALKEVRRILRKRGYLLLDVPSKSNIIDMLLRLFRKEPTWGLRIDKTHVAFFDENSMQRLLNSAGFDVTYVKGVSFVRYDLMSILSITWDKRKWWLPRLLDSIAHKSYALRSKGAIQIFLCQSTR